MQLRPLALCLTLLSLASAVDHAQADDKDRDETRRLDEVVVQAEREPGNFVIDDDEVQFIQASDLSDLLSDESGVAVGGGSGVSQKVYVRGFEDTMLNVTIDGAQQPAELYHHQTRVQIEPEFIRSIELDAGAGAATAGPGALTGVLRVRTKDAFDMLRADQSLGALIKTSADFSGENSYKGVASVYGRIGENLGVMATYVDDDGGDYEDGHGNLVTPTAYDHERSQLKLSGVFSVNSFDLQFESLDDSGTYFERPHMTNYSGRFILSDHRMRRDTVSYNHRYDPDSDAVDVELTAFHNESAFENRRNTTGLVYGFGEQTSNGFDLRNTSRWNNLLLAFGIDHRRDRLDATQQATPPAYWGSSRQNASVSGAYIQAEWHAANDWLLSGGLRYDRYQHQVDEGVGAGADNTKVRFSPNLSLHWSVTDSFSLRAAYSQAFRGITIREAFFSALYAHHGDLEGEDADNIELGFAWEHDGHFLRGTAFRQHIDNFIGNVFVGPPSPEWGYWTNLGTARVEGYELEAGRSWSRIEASIGVWNSDNTFEGRPLNDSDLGLGTTIGRTWTARWDWRPQDNAHYGIRARYVEPESNPISPEAPVKSSYAVLDLAADWSFLDDRLSFGLAVKNALDKFYYDHATYTYNPRAGVNIGFPSRGREFVTSLTYHF
ncbi:MAG: TonB-dependent receptor [Xanthomonadales bacterium]|nr:TonB-dependent receptor [Xanthomonadales bacterium]